MGNIGHEICLQYFCRVKFVGHQVEAGIYLHDFFRSRLFFQADRKITVSNFIHSAPKLFDGIKEIFGKLAGN